MDRMPSGNNHKGFADSNVFADSQQYNAYDHLHLFQNDAEPNFHDASWGVNASDYPSSSRGHQPAPASHLPAASAFANYNTQPSSYTQPLKQNPAQFVQSPYSNYGAPQNYLPPTQQQYDPSLVAHSTSGTNVNHGLANSHASGSNARTIAPQALEHGPPYTNFGSPVPYGSPSYNPNEVGQARSNSAVYGPTRDPPINQHALISAVPPSSEAGIFSIIKYDDLARSTSSERMGNFLNIGKQSHEWNITRSAIPTYVPRKSRNELRALAGNNPSILAKIGKKSTLTKSLTRAPKVAKPFPNSNQTKSEQEIKYESQSSSDEESSSDDDSAYSDEDDIESPLPSTRPENLSGAVEYDTIKALWRSRRRPVDGESIRQGLVGFWEIVKTIRDRWKADSAAVADAEEKKRTGEIPLLMSRVKDQRDMIEVAFKAALKHGNRAIVELLAENVSLVFLCYQFLLDRFKDDDVNGSLSRALLETMSIYTTLTEEKLEKTHLIKVLPRYQKKGDAKTQYWVKKINGNAEAASKEAAEKQTTQEKSKMSSSSAETKSASPPVKRAAVEQTAGVKRAASTSADNTSQKRLATGSIKSNGAITSVKSNGTLQKPAVASDGTKQTSSASTATITRKTVVAKPSGFLSSLQSASKKPGTSIADKPASVSIGKTAVGKTATAATAPPKPAFSFAETMANLSKPKEEKAPTKSEKENPPENPDDRAKRLRKEERRKFHVSFKTGDDLVQIRYFTHDPEEDMEHSSSQKRDVADVGGEGRMFKQQQRMMDIDDEDEAAEEAEHLIDFKPPSVIDFSVVDEEERNRNYAPFGGGEMKVESAERSIRESYENSTLIVFYTDAAEIPPDPREPADPYNGVKLEDLTYFGVPDEKYAARARAKKNNYSQPPASGHFNKQTPEFQLSSTVSSLLDKHQQQQSIPSANPMPAYPSQPDIQQILATLRQSAPTQNAFGQPQPPAAGFNQPFTTPTSAIAYQAPPAAPPSANIDLAAILATLNSNNNQNQQYGGAAASAPPPMMGYAAPTQQPQPLGGTGGGATATEDLSQEELAKIKAKNPFYKTKICRFWQEGRCQKGATCSYVHE